jgi:hypothetical protein
VSTFVFVVVDRNGKTTSINATRAGAQAKIDRFNADPFIEPGKPDPAAPYRIEEWSVNGGEPIRDSSEARSENLTDDDERERQRIEKAWDESADPYVVDPIHEFGELSDASQAHIYRFVSALQFESGDMSLAAIEAQHIELVLNLCEGSKSAAARVLGIDRRTLYRRLGAS